ncbi:MAG: tetratricopeptide (TPR) repeat protein [Lentimonas sp.]|jgi:tetratricopeptide (TPR) repeat protein
MHKRPEHLKIRPNKLLFAFIAKSFINSRLHVFSGQPVSSYLMKSCYLTLFVLISGLSSGFSEIEISPTKTSHALVADGYTQLNSGHKNEALATFSEVLKHDASNLDARFGQAIIFAAQNRHKDAFTAYDSITQQNPQHINAWNGRGMAAFNMEDFDEALVSFQMSVADQPVNGFFYESIAWTQMCRGEFQEAAESAKQASLMYNRKGETSLYPLLIAYFSYHESGDSENALRALQYASKDKSANKWPAPVIDYLNGKIDEAVLISFVTNLAEETEAHTYIGLYMRLLGETEKANRHLNWVSQHGDSQVFEYTLAKALKLQSDVVLLDR